MPYYKLTDKLQIVTRYTHLSSSDNGPRLSRYDSRAVGGRGDSYDEIYLGLNYYLYGHKFKIQTGLQYTDMDDAANDGGKFNGWNWTTALRLSW